MTYRRETTDHGTIYNGWGGETITAERYRTFLVFRMRDERHRDATRARPSVVPSVPHRRRERRTGHRGPRAEILYALTRL
jgi:hypothetical protein